jgi:hypothetical protein
VAAFLKVSVQTIYRWNKVGYGPTYACIGIHNRYDRATVLAWWKERLAEGPRTKQPRRKMSTEQRKLMDLSYWTLEDLEAFIGVKARSLRNFADPDKGMPSTEVKVEKRYTPRVALDWLRLNGFGEFR